MSSRSKSLLSALLTAYLLIFFFFNDTATTEIYTLSLHDALPISSHRLPPTRSPPAASWRGSRGRPPPRARRRDRKSTRLNSSHGYISYAVFCLKKKKKNRIQTAQQLPADKTACRQ